MQVYCSYGGEASAQDQHSAFNSVKPNLRSKHQILLAEDFLHPSLVEILSVVFV